ncbi:MAG TPA: 2'-5' RNA ligase family protein [Nocardioides sp.]
MDGLDGATLAAVVVVVPEAEPVVGRHRADHDPSAAWGVPAHVTVLFPFVSPARLDESVVDRLALAVAKVPAFDVVFGECGWFDADVLWLAPAPAEPFRELTRMVWEEFPEQPPYAGEFVDLTPHLTVAQRGGGAVLRDIEATVTAELPVVARVDSVSLIAGRPEPDSWRSVAALPLGD